MNDIVANPCESNTHTHTHGHSLKDWTGNKATTFAQLGASNHTDTEREINDFYATDPHTLKIFLDKLKEDNIQLHNLIWECACGQGHLSKVLEEEHNVLSTDLVDRGYGKIADFLQAPKGWKGDILTNPPYKYAKEFVEKSLDILEYGRYGIFLLKIQFLEGQDRWKLFKEHPPKYVYVNSKRQTCYINGDMSKKMSSASCYCWFIWQKGWYGETKIRWIKGE